MSEVKGAIKEITANEYKIENVKGIFIKELVDQRLLVLENMMYGYNVRSVQRNINLIYQKEYVLGS